LCEEAARRVDAEDADKIGAQIRRDDEGACWIEDYLVGVRWVLGEHDCLERCEVSQAVERPG